MAVVSLSLEQLNMVVNKRPLEFDRVVICDGIVSHHPWRENEKLPPFNYVIEYRVSNRPGFIAFEMDSRCNVVHEWSGGLD
jgi:hypothetical protein